MSDQTAADRPPLSRIPHHVAIIMDGNGRWAQKRGLPRLVGHRAGTENIRRVLQACVEFGVKTLTIYAFSTENWGRPKAEVMGLIHILGEVIDRETAELNRNGVQLRHIGRMDGIPEVLQKKVLRAIDVTRNNSQLVLNVAFNYGGRDEIVYAIREILESGISAEQVTEKTVSDHLFTAGQPDPDLIVRTGGDWRLSNFLIWQAAYAEYYSTPVFWPDFDKDELFKALLAFSERERRFGLVPGKK